MKRKKLFIILAILTLVITSLACGLFGGDDEPTEPAVSEDQPIENTSPQEPVDQSEDDKSTGGGEAPQAPADIDLGEEYRSEEGGYAFHPIPEYEMEEFFGLTSMIAPNADEDLGPMVMLIGGTNEEETTNEEIFDKFMEDVEDEDVEILNQKEITIDGKPGILADIGGDVDGQQVIGRIVVIAVSPTHQFTMFGTAPEDQWNEVSKLFDAVLVSIYFFEPQEVDFSGSIDEAVGEDEGDEDEGDVEEPDAPPVDELVEFPTTYSELPAGGFAYLLAGDQGLPTIVTQGNIQDQSTSAEYVIGLISEDQNNTVTLFIPLNVSSGVLVMLPYDSSSATKGPGAAVYKGVTLFTNTDGIIMIEAMSDNTISGTFSFMAVDESGNELAVTGFFNQLPLEQ